MMVDLSIMTGNRCTAPDKNFIWKQSVAQKETPFIQRLDAADLRVSPYPLIWQRITEITSPTLCVRNDIPGGGEVGVLFEGHPSYGVCSSSR